MFGRDRIFHEQHQKSVLAFVFDIGNAGPRFEFTAFDERKRGAALLEFFVGIDQGILHHQVIEFIPK